jgi:hypothetical protein
VTPDDIQNMLIRDNNEKQRQELAKKYAHVKSIKRLTLQ